MASRKIFFLFLASIFWLLASQCAQIVNPNGGPKDVKPPRTVKYFPDSAQTNFSAKNITISFDEYIQLNDLQKQLVISPPMNVQPEVKAKGKILFIELKDSLRKNTTYTFNFGDAIRDFTESNALENFQYVFSTGSYIDSLTLSGTVQNTFDLKTDKGILVMLYDTHDDSVPCKKLPSYFTKTNANGSYKINNIRSGTYKAFALKDANNNYLYDVPTESIAFSDTLINIKKNTSLNLSLFMEEPKKQKLLKVFFPEHGHLVFALARPMKNYLDFNFLSQKPKERVLVEHSKNNDTLHYWFVDDLVDTIKIEVSEEGKVIDTVRIKPITIEQMKKNIRGDKWGLKVNANLSKDKIFDLNKTLVFYFNHPIQSFNSQGIEIKNRNQHDCKFVLLDDEIRKSFIIKCKSDSAKTENKMQAFPYDTGQYSIFIPPGIFTDIFGLTNDTVKLDFKTQEEKYYGTLKLTSKMKIRIKYILQLMNEKGEMFGYASSDKGVFSYQYLPPGSYKLRIIYDKNGDDKWTTGNYLEKKKPETVIYYSSPITIRSNWDLELDWKVE